MEEMEGRQRTVCLSVNGYNRLEADRHLIDSESYQKQPADDTVLG